MSRKIVRGLIVAIVGLLGAGSTAVAGDYQLWREQVATDRGLTLEPAATRIRPRLGSDDRLWRDQVRQVEQRIYSFRVVDADAGGYLLWREQIKGP